MAAITDIQRYTTEAQTLLIHVNDLLVAGSKQFAREEAKRCRDLIVQIRQWPIERDDPDDMLNDQQALENLGDIERELNTLMPPHGGAGRGQGRHSLSDEPTESSRITMPASYWEYIRDLGGGNASKGIRQLIEQAKI